MTTSRICGLLVAFSAMFWFGCGGADEDPGSDRPVARAGGDKSAAPNSMLELDASESVGIAGEDITYLWRVESQPQGSRAHLAEGATATPRFLPDLLGDYELCLVVTNVDGIESRADCIMVAVRTDAALYIELTWTHPDAATDLDLHYVAPDGQWFDSEQHMLCTPNGPAVWWCVSNPDWGGGEGGRPDGDPGNDPALVLDNIHGDGPEVIRHDQLIDGTGFRIGVHNFCDGGSGPSQARVRVWVDGELELDEEHLLGMQEFWEVAHLDVANGGQAVTITSTGGEIFETGYGECP